jgi:hypothetical protein
MAPMATGARDLSCFPVDTTLKLVSRNGPTQGMLFHKFDIGMTALTRLMNIGNMRHRSRVLAWKDIMFSMAIKTIRCRFRSFHDPVRMKTLLILFFCFLVATLTIYPPVGSFLSTLGMGIIRYFCMAVGAGEASMNGILEARFRYKKGDFSSTGILL